MSLIRRLRVKPGHEVTLDDRGPRSTPGVESEAAALAEITRDVKRLEELQYRLHAEGQHGLLIVLQGMDASGKDGVVRHVMSGFDPLGCRVQAFKAPTAEELGHDFLWRVHRVVPARGEIVIFNRSHYEDVLAVRVHELVPKSVWRERYEQINAFEELLASNGTTVLKFCLNVSRAEQRRRLLARLDDPTKRWKFNAHDLEERKRWKDYQRAYADVLSRCSTAHAPWYVIPADHKWYRDYAISRILTETLGDLDPRLPAPRLDVKGLRAQLS